MLTYGIILLQVFTEKRPAYPPYLLMAVPASRPPANRSSGRGGDAVVPAVYGPTTLSCHCCLRLLGSDRFRACSFQEEENIMGLAFVIPTGKAGAAWCSAGRRPCAPVPGLQLYTGYGNWITDMCSWEGDQQLILAS